MGGQNTHPKLYYKSQLLPKIFRYLFSISIFCLLEGFLSHSLSILLGIKFSSEKLYCMAAYLQGRGIARVGKRFVSQISYSGTPNPSLSSSFLLRYLINYWYYIYINSVRSSYFGGVVVIVVVFFCYLYVNLSRIKLYLVLVILKVREMYFEKREWISYHLDW